MFRNTKISNAVRLAMVFGSVATAASFSMSAVAAEEEEVKKVERIEVTGSRIKRTDIESASPVFVMDREAIASAGQVSIGDILQQIPSAGAALNTAFNNGGNGATNMDLRNLGAQRLLVLVNGRRWIAGLDSTVDLNTIPTSAIERVEVLKDGASALYGSDAIAGVVNIITRKDFEGVELSSYAGENASEGDGRKYTAEMTVGTSTEKSGILFNMSHTTQQPIFAGDREISATGFSSTGRNTRLGITRATLNPANQAAMDANGYKMGQPANNRYDLMTKEGTGTNTGIGQLRARAAGNGDNYNYAPDNYLVTPQNRNSFYVQAYHDINDNLRFVSDFVYTNRKSSQELAPMPVVLGEASGGQSGARVDIHANNIYNPFRQTLYGSRTRALANGAGFDKIGADGKVVLDANGNPVKDYVAYNLQRRMVEAGPRNFAQDDDSYRGMVGLEGSFGDTSWSWDSHYIYGQNSQTEFTTGLLNLTRINRALGDNCTAANNCTPLNLFGGPGTITPEMLDFITFDSVNSSGSTLKDYAFNTSGDLFDIPGGTVGAAIGFERREESGFDNPDPLTVTGESSGNQSDPTAGGFRLDEAYAEISIPLMENLLLSPAMRFSDHSVFGDKSTAKVGLEFRPMDDLLLRSTWAQGYRAPSISDLFAGNADSFPNLTDPCNKVTAAGATINGVNAAFPGCAGVPAGYRQGNTQIRITLKSAEDLKPEESESLTLGFVYNPSWLEGAELTVDYYKIDVENAIARIGQTRIITECALSSSAALCALIDRDVNGNVTDLRNPLANQSSYNVAGVDSYMAYRFPETSYGMFKVYLDGSYFIKNEFDGEEQLGVQYGNSGYPRIKSSLGIDWMSGDWSANYQARYVHHMDTYYSTLGGTEAQGYTQVIPTYVIHDVSMSYNLSDYNARVTLGVENLFAKEPTPEGIDNNYAASTNNYSVTEYDSNMDRFVYLRATVKF